MTRHQTDRSEARQVRRAAREHRGQTMVLGGVTLLIIAFMMMLTLSVANAVHEKIRLQTHSDAMAYSMATVEARSFNYFAYSNRAIAAMLVAQMTLHGYYSIASATADVMAAGKATFIEIAIGEVILCCLCTWCSCIIHCKDAIKAGKIAIKYNKASKKWGNKVKGWESKFNLVVKLLGVSNLDLHAHQAAMQLHVANVLLGNDLDKVTDSNKCSKPLPKLVGAIAVLDFACAIEGAASDDACKGPGSTVATDRVARSKVMTNAANAARPEFDYDRGVPVGANLGPTFLKEVQDIPGEGISTVGLSDGSSRLINGNKRSQCTSNKNNTEGTNVCGRDDGAEGTVGWRHIPIAGWTWESFIDSGSTGGKHEPKKSHSGTHSDFKGVQKGKNDLTGAADCLATGLGNCFVNFRADSDEKKDFQQPHTYAHYEGNLRSLRDDCTGKKPWELGTNGKVTIGDGARGNGVLNLVPTKQGLAVSKAMAYFHRFDDWQAPPNMFDPYWRAKLHPFEKAELALVMAAAGDFDGAAMSLTTPVEGM